VTRLSQPRFRRIFLSLSRAAVVLVAGLAAMPQATYARADTHFEALPLVRSRQNHLMVRAFINGKEAWLTIDSGAPVSAIASNRRNYFRLKPTTAKSDLPEPLVTVDLGNSARAARLAHEEQIDGIIGADILFPTEAVLDCHRQLLILKTDPKILGGVPGLDRRGLQAVPMQVSDGFNLYVNGSINGRPTKFMVDTGSFATLLHRSFVKRMRIATRETQYSSSAVNLKDRGLRLAHIRKLSVGSVDIVGKDIGVIDMEGLIHDGLLDGSPPVAGLLGAETLRRHHGIIDFGTRTLYLQKRETPWQRSNWRRSAGPNLTY
jgi:predicted aspartyl protease